MLLPVLILLAVSGTAVCSSCVDGVDNIIQIYDTTEGNGKILVKDVEIGMYDKDKNPICGDGKPQITFPGYFKLFKGTVEVKEDVKGDQPIRLSVSLEKNSFMVGVVCEKGKSKNSFVPNELCSFNLCDLWSMCNLLRVKTTTAIDIKSLIKQEYLYSDSIPSPYVSGEWKVSIDLIQGQNVLGSLQIGKLTEWLTVENAEDDFEKNHEEF